MTENEAEELVLSFATVTPQRVTLAKAYIVGNFHPDSRQLIESFARAIESLCPQQVVVHGSADTLSQARQGAGLSQPCLGRRHDV